MESFKYQLLRAVFILFLLASMPHVLEAQILIGPTAGGQINLYTFDDKDLKDAYKLNSDVNFNAGISLAFKANKNFFLHSSFLYAQKGKIVEGKIDPTLRNTQTLRFIDVPILYTAEFKSKIGKDKVFKWYLGAGPTISYWLGGKGLLINGDLNENFINPPDYNLPYKIVFRKDSADVQTDEMNVREPNRIQLGLNVSFGLIFEPINRQRFMFNARFGIVHSFLSRETDGEFGLPGILYYEDELQVRNQELVLALHYFIDLKTDQRKKGKSTVKDPNSKPKR